MRNTDDYIIFFHLVEQGSFSAAARQMELTKSVVSKRIAKLEQEIGVQLLYRTTRTLKLTEAGQSFFEHARSVYQAVATAEESIVGLGKSYPATSRLPFRPSLVNLSFLTLFLNSTKLIQISTLIWSWTTDSPTSSTKVLTLPFVLGFYLTQA